MSVFQCYDTARKRRVNDKRCSRRELPAGRKQKCFRRRCPPAYVPFRSFLSLPFLPFLSFPPFPFLPFLPFLSFPPFPFLPFLSFPSFPYRSFLSSLFLPFLSFLSSPFLPFLPPWSLTPCLHFLLSATGHSSCNCSFACMVMLIFYIYFRLTIFPKLSECALSGLSCHV